MTSDSDTLVHNEFMGLSEELNVLRTNVRECREQRLSDLLAEKENLLRKIHDCDEQMHKDKAEFRDLMIMSDRVLSDVLETHNLRQLGPATGGLQTAHSRRYRVSSPLPVNDPFLSGFIKAGDEPNKYRVDEQVCVQHRPKQPEPAVDSDSFQD